SSTRDCRGASPRPRRRAGPRRDSSARCRGGPAGGGGWRDSRGIPSGDCSPRAASGRPATRGAGAGTTMRPCPPDADAMTAPATPPPYLDEAQIEALSDLLDRRAVPFKGFNLEALDGFLTALAVSPSPVPPGEWQPVVWGGKPPRWDDAAEDAAVQQLLMGHWNMCVARVRYGEEDLPDHLAPLMWLPEDP